MKYTSLLVACAALVSAAPSTEVNVVKRDVWNPVIKYPNLESVWEAGYTYEVIWYVASYSPVARILRYPILGTLQTPPSSSVTVQPSF